MEIYICIYTFIYELFTSYIDTYFKYLLLLADLTFSSLYSVFWCRDDFFIDYNFCQQCYLIMETVSNLLFQNALFIAQVSFKKQFSLIFETQLLL